MKKKDEMTQKDVDMAKRILLDGNIVRAIYKLKDEITYQGSYPFKKIQKEIELPTTGMKFVLCGFKIHYLIKDGKQVRNWSFSLSREVLENIMKDLMTIDYAIKNPNDKEMLN